MRDTRRYWYFITEEDMGDKMSLTPRTPYRMGDDEPNLKRICVAPTAAHCFSAINIYSPLVHVYRTLREVKAVKPYGVGDSGITKEHWLLGKTRFERVTVVSVPRARWRSGSRGGEMPHFHNEQRKDKRKIFSQMRKRDHRLCTIGAANARWKGKEWKPTPEPIPAWGSCFNPSVAITGGIWKL